MHIIVHGEWEDDGGEELQLSCEEGGREKRREGEEGREKKREKERVRARKGNGTDEGSRMGGKEERGEAGRR